MGWMIGFEYEAKKEREERCVVIPVPKMAKAHYFIFILSCSGPTLKIAPEPKRLFEVSPET